MPVHQWKHVEAGIFHAFHHGWITEFARSLNHGLLPSEYYALPEQIDILALKRPSREAPDTASSRCAEPDRYAAKAKAVVVRHSSGNQVIAIVEIVSPGNKSSRNGFRAFVSKAVEVVRAGVHLLIVDLFPPGPRDPCGVHKAIWDEFIDNDYSVSADKPLTLVSYRADDWPEAFVEPSAAGSPLIDMPLFLSSDTYVPVPLEATYQAAFENLPAYVKNEVVGSVK